MPDLPRIPQRFKRPDILIEVICLIILLESWTYAVYSFNHMANVVSLSHLSPAPLFSAQNVIWVFPVLATLTFIVISWISSFPHKLHYKETVTRINARRIYRKKQRRLRILKLILVLICGTGLLLVANFGNG